MNKEDIKFRYYKGEKENPWDDNKKETFKQATFWFLEKGCAEAGASQIMQFWAENQDDARRQTEGYDVPDGEKALAAYILFGGDGFIPESALADYFKATPFVSKELAD